MLAYFFFKDIIGGEDGAASNEWLNIQRHCFSSRLAREFSAQEHGGKSNSNSSIRQRIGETCLSFECGVFTEGELFLDLAICCLQINPNYFRGKKNTLQNIELGKVRYLKVWLFPTFARDGPCVTGEVGEQTKECHDSNLGANLSITTLPLLPLDKTQQKLRDVTHIGHYTCMCASVAIDMCGLSNPILCCLFLLQVNYIYVYFKKE